MLCAYGHPDQETPSENSTIFTPNFICFFWGGGKTNHAAPLDITTSSYGSAFTGKRHSTNG
jgi:hypothetical protein